MQSLEVSWAVRDIYDISRLRVKGAYVGFIREQFGIRTIKNINHFICGLFHESLRQLYYAVVYRSSKNPGTTAKF